MAAYNSILQRPKDRGLTTALHILDNEAIWDYIATIKDKWGVDLQLVFLDIHRKMQQNGKSVLSSRIS